MGFGPLLYLKMLGGFKAFHRLDRDWCVSYFLKGAGTQLILSNIWKHMSLLFWSLSMHLNSSTYVYFYMLETRLWLFISLYFTISTTSHLPLLSLCTLNKIIPVKTWFWLPEQELINLTIDVFKYIWDTEGDLHTIPK